MTMINDVAPAMTRTGKSLRSVQIYAGIVGLLGLDLLLLTDWIASVAFVDAAVTQTFQIGWILRGLGGSCVALAAILLLLARSSMIGITPLLAFAAGASTLALLGIGWGHLTITAELALLLIAANDFGFGLWMRRDLAS